jgi:AcrR family transcriptional regulator
MKEPLRERKKKRTRAAILENAARIFREKGFDATTLGEIAEAAEVHKQTVLRYFRSKEEIAFARRIRLFEVFEEELKARPGTVLEYWRAYIERTSTATSQTGELRAWYEFLDSDTRLFAFQLRLNERYQAVLATALSEEAGVDPENDLFARVVAAMLVSGNTSAARLSVRQGDGGALVRNALAVVDLAAAIARPPAARSRAASRPRRPSSSR